MSKESEVNQIMEPLLKSVPKKKQEILRKELTGKIEKMQNSAFMEGYQYAIELLKESVVYESAVHKGK